MTALKKTADEVGAIEFPAVMDLLNYWLKYPPEHLLLRAMAGFETTEDRSNWRSRRAKEMGDSNYKEPEEIGKGSSSVVGEFPGLRSGGARHLDCAPPHIQQAIERFKKNQHHKINKPE